MSIGRTFRESLMKALRSLEIDRYGLADPEPGEFGALTPEEKRAHLEEALRVPGPDRIWEVARAIREGWTEEEIYGLSWIDPWFLAHLAELVALEEETRAAGLLEDEARLILQ